MKRDLPFTRQGDPKNSRTLLRIVTAGIAMLLATTLVVPAHADDLDDRRDRLNEQIAQTQRDLTHSDQQLDNAAAALHQAEAELASAQAELARVRQELAAAQAHDAAMAEKLALAEEELRQAEAAVEEGLRNLATEQKMVGNVARHSYQNRADLMPIAVLVQDDSLSNMQTRLQWSNTMQQATEADMERLRAIQEKLDADKAEKERIEKQVAADRQAAAEALAATEQLEAQAAHWEQQVNQRVNEHASAKAAAEQVVAEEQARYEALTSERNAVEQRIQERIAREKAEAERRAAEEKAARERAAQQRAAQARQSQTSRSSSAGRPAAPKTSASKGSGNSAPAPSGGLVMPVAGPITSQYGMRLHPITRIYKLHDGTDWGAACGTPIRAVANGRVTERYFNAGYGNRLQIDHGTVNGRYLTTSYNHLSRYNVSVGQRVSKGQVIGYVGTTGYSTGCHLHFMAWQNGRLVNPMTLF